jgi:hypothetical protein
MLGVVTAELVLQGLMLLWFAVRLWLTGPVRWWRTPVGRQLMTFTAVQLAETVSLVLLGVGHPPSMLVFVVVFGLSNFATAGWVLLQYHARNGHTYHLRPPPVARESQPPPGVPPPG